MSSYLKLKAVYKGLLMSFRYIIIFLLIHTQAVLSEQPTQSNSVLLAVENSWPPYAGSNGQGIATEIIKAAFAEVDIQLYLKVMPYARVLNEVEKGVIVGGYNVTRQASTEKQFLFGEQTLLTASASMYFSADNIQASEFNNIADVPSGTSVGLIIDYEYGDLFEQHINRFKQVRVSSQEQVINMLRLGRIDSAILFDAVARHTLKSMKLAEDSIYKGPQNHTSDIYVAFSRKHDRAQFFADQLDHGLALIKANGQYESLFK